VHLASIGHGCLGDALYGGRTPSAPTIARQALHAYTLAVDHPRTGQELEFRAPLAGDMTDYLRARGLEYVGPMIDEWVNGQKSAGPNEVKR
jgi:23S rRNA pseudouridine1911/1915/1917 synthase